MSTHPFCFVGFQIERVPVLRIATNYDDECKMAETSHVQPSSSIVNLNKKEQNINDYHTVH